MSRVLAFAHRLLSDADAADGLVELRIVLAQAIVIGAPVILIGVGLMAVLP